METHPKQSQLFRKSFPSTIYIDGALDKRLTTIFNIVSG